MKSKRVWLLSGLPGSGKSTWVSKKIAELEPGTAVVVSRDIIRFGLLKDGEDYFSKEDEVWNLFIKATIAAIKNPCITDIFIDATHLNDKSRKKTLRPLPLENVEVINVVFDVPLNVCFERNAQRTGRAYVPEKVIRSMAETFSLPNIHKSIFVDKEGGIRNEW